MTRKALSVVLCICLAIGPAVAEDLGNVKFAREATGTEVIPPAIFPHSMHRIVYKCAACHDSLFPMKAGSTKVTMDAIQDGKFCGACHNGKLAFASTFATCSRCHRE